MTERRARKAANEVWKLSKFPHLTVERLVHFRLNRTNVHLLSRWLAAPTLLGLASRAGLRAGHEN